MGLGQYQQVLPPAGLTPPPPGFHYVVDLDYPIGAVWYPPGTEPQRPLKWKLVPDDPRKTYVPPSPEGGPTRIGTTLGSIPWWGWLAGAAAAVYVLAGKR
jgi:hypothetical protein